MLVKTVLPFFLDGGDKVILRTSLNAMTEQPVFNSNKNDFDSERGLGDIAYDLSYAPTIDEHLIRAAGIVGRIPSATLDSLGSDRWAIGPSFRFGRMNEKSIYGIYSSHQWDVGGSGDAEINVTNLQVFGIFLPGGGWSYGTAPLVTYDHEIEEWTIPINFNFGRTIVRNGKPMKFAIELNYYIDQPEAFGQAWGISFNITPLIKKSRRKLFKRLPCTSADGC